MPDLSLNPVTPITNGGLVGASNPLPVTVIGGLFATLGANTFTGNQTVVGVLTANRLNLLNGGRRIQFRERSDPVAPAADTAFLYVRDNGAGKTQLVVPSRPARCRSCYSRP
jgi:hypothetical protein